MSENNPNNIYNLPEDQIKMPEDTSTPTSPKGGGLSIISILVVVIVILTTVLIGAVYWYWDTLFPPSNIEVNMTEPMPETPTASTPEEPEPIQSDEKTMTNNELSTSDDLGDIEADLANTNVDNLDPEMSELEASFSN